MGLGYNYLIRAQFMYGNYDGKNMPPTFNLFIGVDFWADIILETASSRVFYEIVHKPTTDYINVCLINTNKGTPFISALYLRPLNSSMYNFEMGSLYNYNRYFMDASGSVPQGYLSYLDDPYDRFWAPLPRQSFKDWDLFSRTNANMSSDNDLYKIPSMFYKTGAKPYPGNHSLAYYSTPNDPNKLVFYIYWHFVETQNLSKHDSREFVIYSTGNSPLGPITLNYMRPITIASPPIVLGSVDATFSFSINQTNASTLPPILTAYEVYSVVALSQRATNQSDVNAIMKIKTMSGGLIRGWQGDPCLPVFPWSGLNCSDDYSPSIISLNLAFKGLNGEIMPALSNLTSLNYLNLSYNALTGRIPEFLATMPSLQVIDLRGNNLSGPVPAVLMAKVKSGLLSLSWDGDPNLCTSDSCESKSKNRKVMAIVALSVSLCVVLIIVAVFCICRMKSNAGSHGMQSKSRKFTYREVINITNNFQTIIGKGGCGNVYSGSLEDGTEVAVKLLNPSSALSFKSFQTEAELLVRVHHRNLVSLVGYCDEESTMALIYDYMANGDVHKYLSGNQTDSGNWRQRLQISLDAAQGIEYLHNGCKPAIVHRDIKTANILLDDKMQAKIADFGMSRIFVSETATHYTTINVAGTPGYLDPEVVANCSHTVKGSYKLNEKSDVYSFGVILLEMITGRTVFVRSENNVHITNWVTPLLERGEICKIMDARFNGFFSINSAWKAVETAMACASAIAVQRPSMAEVVNDLKECLALELAYENSTERGGRETSDVLNQTIHIDLEATAGPSAR